MLLGGLGTNLIMRASYKSYIDSWQNGKVSMYDFDWDKWVGETRSRRRMEKLNPPLNIKDWCIFPPCAFFRVEA